MAETYLQLTQKIEELQHKAESIRGQEMAGVIERIKIAIHAYGLTADQLFGATASGNAKSLASGKKPATRVPGKKPASSARFMDDQGNSWSGRGPRPGWIKAALAAGKSIEQYAVGQDSTPAAAGKPAPKAAGKTSADAKFKDDAGNSWSGRGPRPRWFKAALESGKTADQLMA